MKANFEYGQPISGDPDTDSFFRLFGDTDGDRDVDIQDYGAFARSFLSQLGDANYNAAVDFDGDGDVDGNDMGQFRRSLSRRL